MTRWLTYAVSAVMLSVAVLAVLGGLPWKVSLNAVTVKGGSMGDALPAGGVAITQRVAPADVRAGDVIAIEGATADTLVLHRVKTITSTPAGLYVTTRGDANVSDDPGPTLLRGEGDRVLFAVPFAGYAFAFIRRPEGLVALAGGVALVLLLEAAVRQRRRLRSARSRRSDPTPDTCQAPLGVEFISLRMRAQKPSRARGQRPA